MQFSIRNQVTLIQLSNIRPETNQRRLFAASEGGRMGVGVMAGLGDSRSIVISSKNVSDILY